MVFLKGSLDATCTITTSSLNWNVLAVCTLGESFPLSHIKPFSDASLRDVTQTQGQASLTIVDWH